MPVYDGTLFDPPAPLARVTLRNFANGESVSDIAMLIDSGADITLVPRASILPLGLLSEPSTEYEIMGFNGRTTLARAIQLDLIFLRKVFRGQFLVDNRDYGILGRDILNHLPILLDGPRLTWDEAKRNGSL